MNRYCVIQYTPGLVGEAINIAVFCFGDKGMRYAATERWERVRSFAECDITFLKDFAKELDEKRIDGTINGHTLHVMAQKWSGDLHVLTPRASTRELDALFDWARQHFLEGKEKEKDNG